MISMTSLSAAVLAQASGPADPIPESVQVQNIMDFLQKGGIMMIPIGLCSLVALTVIIERLITLRRKSVIPPKFLPGLRKLMTGKPGNTEAALNYCRQNKSAIANVFAAGIRKIDRRSPEAVEKSIEDAGEREVLKLRKYLRALSVIASVTPLLGLLGTILGMIVAFQTVAISGEALGKTELLAEGIYQAMITTAAGLSIAIPVLICYHWISGKIEKLVADIDQMTVDFVDEFGDGHPAALEPVARRSAEPARTTLADAKAKPEVVEKAVHRGGDHVTEVHA